MMAIQQLHTLSGVAKGLTRLTDGIRVLIFSHQDQEQNGQLDAINRARELEDPQTIKLGHESIFAALRGVVDLWLTDAEVAVVSLIQPSLVSS
jgi:hypothetical protein